MSSSSGDQDKSVGTSSDDLGLTSRSVVQAVEARLGLGEDLRLREMAGESAPAIEFKPDDRRYQILGEVGKGGMGTVYLAYDTDLKRRVALKVVTPRPDLDESLLRRFLEEATWTAQLEHPNIVPIYDIGRSEDGRHFYTMRYVRGTSLEELLADLARRDATTRKRWSLFRLIQAIQQVAMAVDYAHVKGVVHRDVKPSNVMTGPFGEVVVMDWGLARILNRPEPPVPPGPGGEPRRVLVGTPAYMAPEQAAGQAADDRSDIYALGVIFYRMLTLRLPFQNRDLKALLEQIRNDEPLPPSKHNPRVPEQLEAICMKALAKDPGRRYARARELHDALLSFLDGARQQSARQGVARENAQAGISWVRRHNELRAELAGCEERLEQLEVETPGWLPLEQKKPLLELRRELESLQQEVELAFGSAVDHLSRALGAEPGHRRARIALADLYYEHFLDAEHRGDPAQMRSARRLVETYHDGRYARQLRGDGELQLQSEPGGALVALYAYEEIGLVLEPVWQEQLGRTPLRVRLPMGSYLLLVEAAGHAPVHYPVHIERMGRWEGRVRLYTQAEIGPGFCHVPAGPYISGGDSGTLTSLPYSRPELDDFFIAKDPVTGQEYLEFLNDLAGRDAQQAQARAPRRGPEEGPYWKLGGDGQFELPEVDPEGDRHDLSWPVLAISWHDAEAYCRWRTRRDGRRYELPSEAQWEKAARGVDGRIYPWGNRFDPGLTNMRNSRERAGPVASSALKLDISPYGVRGMAGNVEEWTRDNWGDSRGSVVGRGGSWTSNAVMVRCAYRSAVEPHLVAGIRGFRVMSPEPLRPRSGQRG